MEHTEVLGQYAQSEPPAANREFKDRLFKAIFGRDKEDSKCWRLDLFGSTLVKIPAPSFIVFYNGDRELPDVSEQKLSDAFEPAGSTKGFEWTAKVINIGGKHSEALQKKCKALYDYCSYVNPLPYGKLMSFPLRGNSQWVDRFATRA